MLNQQEYLLRAFSDGHIGWREACQRLGLADFSALAALLTANNLPLYQPNSPAYSAHNQAIDALLYGDI